VRSQLVQLSGVGAGGIKDKPQNSDDIAVALLADVGISQPSDDAKAKALEAYDTMIATLEAIRDDVLGKSSN
jgi:hypothetical protein